MELESVIQTIRDLTNKTTDRGCTEAEARAAMDKVGKLLRVYNLSLSQVFLNKSKCVILRIPVVFKRRHPIDGVVVSLCKLCDCLIWRSQLTKSSVYSIFGMESDTLLVKYLYDVMYRAIDSESTKFKQTTTYIAATSRKLAYVSFRRGMAYRLHERLSELNKQKKEQEAHDTPIVVNGETTTLIVIKQNKVQDEFDALGLQLHRSLAVRRKVHTIAHSAGQEAANKVNLNRPLAYKPAGFLQ